MFSKFQQLLKVCYCGFYDIFLQKSFFGKKKLSDAISPNYLKLTNSALHQLYSWKYQFQSGSKILDHNDRGLELLKMLTLIQ